MPDRDLQPGFAVFLPHLFIIRVLIALRALIPFGLWSTKVIPRFISICHNFACYVINLPRKRKGSIIHIMRIDFSSAVRYSLRKYNMDNLRNSLDMWLSSRVPKIMLDMRNLIRCCLSATYRNINICKYANLINKHSFISRGQFLKSALAVHPPFPLPLDYIIWRNQRFRFHSPPNFQFFGANLAQNPAPS
jgi:hypothetical protein